MAEWSAALLASAIAIAFLGGTSLFYWVVSRGPDACACGNPRKSDCFCLIRRIERWFGGAKW